MKYKAHTYTLVTFFKARVKLTSILERNSEIEMFRLLLMDYYLSKGNMPTVVPK